MRARSFFVSWLGFLAMAANAPQALCQLNDPLAVVLNSGGSGGGYMQIAVTRDGNTYTSGSSTGNCDPGCPQQSWVQAGNVFEQAGVPHGRISSGSDPWFYLVAEDGSLFKLLGGWVYFGNPAVESGVPSTGPFVHVSVVSEYGPTFMFAATSTGQVYRRYNWTNGPWQLVRAGDQPTSSPRSSLGQIKARYR